MQRIVILSILIASTAFSAPEAFEIGPDSQDQLPQGREADGIIGDFVLRNDKVEAVISGNLPLRRANMSTFYGETGITPGNLYDLTLRGANNDQITVFQPAKQQGAVSWVRVAASGKDEAIIETVATAPNNDGLARKHQYRIRDGWQGVLITTTITNEAKVAKKASLSDTWAKFVRTGAAATGGAGILWAESVDPADRCGYALGYTEAPGDIAKTTLRELKPGESVSVSRFLAVADSALTAVGIVAAEQGKVGTISGTVKDTAGKPINGAQIVVRSGGDQPLPKKSGTTAIRAMGIGYADPKGAFAFALPPGKYTATFTDQGRADIDLPLEVKADAAITLSPAMAVASAIQFTVTDADGVSIPCKAQFLAQGDTEVVNLGPEMRAHGCRDQYFSERGAFRVQVPPGTYRVVVTRGIEYSHLAKDVTLKPGEEFAFSGKLTRLVDTAGWVSADYHNHSTPSGDNVCGTDDRVISLAAEHIEFAPTTEHNRLYDWAPHIKNLGLETFVATIPGMELTGSGAHFNSFPFKPVPRTQDNGAPVWNKDPRVTAITLRGWQGGDPDRWIQINHPDMVADFIDADNDGEKDGGFRGLATLIDGIETQNYQTSDLLFGAPFRISRSAKTGRESVAHIREVIWLQLLNLGHRYAAMAVCDAHTVWGNGVGGWRMYMPSASDEPAKIDWRENSRAARIGRSYLTTGPFLIVTTDDGTGPGGVTRAISGGVKLNVRVQCTDWIDIDRLTVLVNSRPAIDYTRAKNPDLFKNGVVKFDEIIPVKLSEDAHIIVVASSSTHDLRTGYGTSTQGEIRPFAYHNPIFVDVDGHGFTPNGDTLDFPLPTKSLDLETAKKLLEARGLNTKPPEPETSL